jgi:hypothetical protein
MILRPRPPRPDQDQTTPSSSKAQALRRLQWRQHQRVRLVDTGTASTTVVVENKFQNLRARGSGHIKHLYADTMKSYADAVVFSRPLLPLSPQSVTPSLCGVEA